MPSASNLSSKLEELGAAPLQGRLPPSKSLAQEFVQTFAPNLPEDYRAFLEEHAGLWLSARCPFLEPTPLGNEASVTELFGFMPEDDGRDVRANTQLGDAAPVAVAIGADDAGNWIYLMCEGPLAGQVLFQDHEGRAEWSDKKFAKELPDAGASIEAYLEQRRSGSLPNKPEALAGFYQLAETFTAFISNCRPDF
jgi:hypothetical protein